MSNSKLFGLAFVAALSFAMTSSVIAQTSYVSPMDLIVQEDQPDVSFDIASISSGALSTTSTPNTRFMDHKQVEFKSDLTRYQNFEQKLTSAYGAPTSTRNGLNIWEIKNQDGVSGQADMVTVMAGEEGGQYFAIVDRRGASEGNNPRYDVTKTPIPTTRSFKPTSRINQAVRD